MQGNQKQPRERKRKGTIRTNEDAQCTPKKKKKEKKEQTQTTRLEQSFLSLVPRRKEAGPRRITIRRYPRRSNVSWRKKKTFNGRVVDRKRKKRGVVRAAATL